MSDRRIDEFYEKLKAEAEKVTLPKSLSSKALFAAMENGDYVPLVSERDSADTPTNAEQGRGRQKSLLLPWLMYAACFMLIFYGYSMFARNATVDAPVEAAPMDISISSQTEEGDSNIFPTSAPNNTVTAQPRTVSVEANYADSYDEIYDEVADMFTELYLDSYILYSEGSDSGNIEAPTAAPNPPTSGGVATDSAAPVPESSLSVESDSAKADGGVYSTNTQSESVDEADIIKTDGECIYHYRFDGKSGGYEVVTTDAETLDVLSRLPMGDEYGGTEMFLYGKSLVVLRSVSSDDTAEYEVVLDTPITAKPLSTQDNAVQSSMSAVDSIMPMPPIVPDYYHYGGNSQMMEALVYDMTEPTKPTLTETIRQEGSYISSRITDDTLYLITQKNIRPSIVHEDGLLVDMIPYVGDENSPSLLPPEDIIISPHLTEASYAVLSTFTFETGNRSSKAILGMVENVSMSGNGTLMMSSTMWDYSADEVNTGISKFTLVGDELVYGGSTLVPGYIDGQFALDEHDGYIRCATTSYDEGETINNVFVVDSDMEIAGEVTGLAPDERIYSVRFMGDTAYIVTFKQVDPLFVIDLSDPENPEVKGELKIPGFSEYLHPYGDGLLIGLGMNTTLNEWGGVQTDGIKLSLFDVSDPTDPTEISNMIIGNSGSSCEAINTHKAFMYYPEENLIGLPSNIIDNSGDSFDGLILTEVSEDGFELHGTLDSQADAGGVMRYEKSYSIDRGIYIGETVYTVSNGRLCAHDIDTLEKLDEVVY